MSEYMQGGALANDDLDFSAPRGRDHAAERSTAAVKSPALNVAIGVSAVAVLAGLASPLKASHILWINLITDSLPALALGTDANDGEALMKEPPRKSTASLFSRGGL